MTFSDLCTRISDFIHRLRDGFAAEVQYEVGGPEILKKIIDEQERRIARGHLPTFVNAYGCVDCGVIQARPANHMCGLCGGSNLVNLNRTTRREAPRKNSQKLRA